MKITPKIIIIVLVLIIAAGLVGWQFGNKNQSANNAPAGSAPQPTTASSGSGSVGSLVSYSLPDGWKENSCPSNADKVYITPSGTNLDCNATPSAPIKIYVDPQGTNDCQQLGNVQNVRKHICSSLYINNHKSLKALTEYPGNTAVAIYYIDTGKGVVAVEYDYTTSNEHQTGFDRLATTVKVK